MGGIVGDMVKGIRGTRWQHLGASLALGSALAVSALAVSALAQPATQTPTAKAGSTPPAPAHPAPVAAPAAAPVAAPQPTNLLEQPPVRATVTQRSNGLMVKADNASLTDILHQVSSATGMKLEGLGGDERVFGSFGPGAPREVLDSLLNGTAYNVLMVGTLPNGAPRQLVLMRKGEPGAKNESPVAATVQQQQNTSDDEENGLADEPDGPQPAPSILPAVIPRPGVPEPVPPGQPAVPPTAPQAQPNGAQPQQQPGFVPDQPRGRTTPQQLLQQLQQQQDLPPDQQEQQQPPAEQDQQDAPVAGPPE